MLKKFKNTIIWGYPSYAFLVAVGLYFFQAILYQGVRFTHHFIKTDLHSTKIAFIDDAIPIILPFVIIYYVSYIFWLGGPIVASKVEKTYYFDALAGIVTAEVIGALIFIFYPTGIDRVAEGLFNDNPGFLNALLQFVYMGDGVEWGYNLMPSYHCLISTGIFLMVYKQPEISKFYRWSAFIFCILVYISTVTVKQHYFIDIPTGIALAVLGHILATRYHLGNRFFGKWLS